MSIVVRVARDFRRALLGCVVTLAVALPAPGQSNADERWVATWATALVVRLPAPPAAPGAPAAPQASAPPAPAAPAAAASTPAAPAAGAPPPAPRPAPPPALTVSDQTLRQIVHTSI